MKIVAISDVHVKYPHDEADNLLCSFLSHPDVVTADKIMLLGDIFDLMCGPHEEYLLLYKHIFDLIDALVGTKKQVYFFEGNHDVHIQGLFSKKWNLGQVIVSQVPIIESLDGKTYYFSHGDEHEIDNLSYQKYKKFIMSPPLKFVAEYVMPYRLLTFLGEKASKMSRKKGHRLFNEELVMHRFRSGVCQTTQGKYNFILGGHSHVKDVFQVSENSVYMNNGYAQRSRTFILIENHVARFSSLS